MPKLELLGVGAFLLAYYYFVLRKYNTLGFRMFSLFTFIAVCVCYWWYVSDRDLKEVGQKGIATQALVLQKTKDDLTVRFTDEKGQTVERTQKGGISVDEFAAVKGGENAPILYSPKSQVIYLESSYQRQAGDNIVILYFGLFLFIIGSVCWVTLRKYRVHAREGSIYEYVTDESGKVVLDDAKNSTTKALRSYTTIGKLLILFRR